MLTNETLCDVVSATLLDLCQSVNVKAMVESQAFAIDVCDDDDVVVVVVVVVVVCCCCVML